MKNIVSLLVKCSNFAKSSRDILGERKLDAVLHHIPLSLQFDIGIVTSTVDEFDEIFKYVDNCQELITDLDDSTIYYSGTIKTSSNEFSIILPYPIAMGLEAAVCNTTKIINSFHPKYLFMVGTCAGNKSVVKIGDIIIADKSVNYNDVVEQYKTGGETKKRFMQNADSISRNFKAKLSRFSRSNSINEIKSEFNKSTSFTYDLSCHLGMLVSGSSLIRSAEKMNEINESYHNVKGLDMETHGFYFTASNSANTAPLFASIKAVSDFGDNTNHPISAEERKRYALHNSVKALLKFIEQEVK